MTRRFAKRLALLVLATVFVGADVTTLGAQTGKIGLVDVQKVLVVSKKGQDVLEKLQVEKEAKQGEIDAQEKKIRQMEKDLEKQRSVLSEDARREREREIRKRTRALRRMVEDLNRDFTERGRDLRARLVREIAEVVRTYGKKNGYVLIIEVREGGVMYGSETADLTKALIDAYDASVGSGKK